MAKAIADQDLQTYLDSYQQLLQAEESRAVFQGLTEFEVMTRLPMIILLTRSWIT